MNQNHPYDFACNCSPCLSRRAEIRNANQAAQQVGQQGGLTGAAHAQGYTQTPSREAAQQAAQGNIDQFYDAGSEPVYLTERERIVEEVMREFNDRKSSLSVGRTLSQIVRTQIRRMYHVAHDRGYKAAMEHRQQTVKLAYHQRVIADKDVEIQNYRNALVDRDSELALCRKAVSGLTETLSQERVNVIDLDSQLSVAKRSAREYKVEADRWRGALWKLQSINDQTAKRAAADNVIAAESSIYDRVGAAMAGGVKSDVAEPAPGGQTITQRTVAQLRAINDSLNRVLKGLQ